MPKPGISAEAACKQINLVAEAACEEWASRVSADPETPLFLYWRAPNKKQRLGRVKVAPQKPRAGWQLVARMVMSPNWTRLQALNYILDRMLWLPILRGPVKE